MSLHVKEAGAWRSVSQPRIKVAGAWKDAKAVHTKVDGVWREVWPGGTGTPRIVGVRPGPPTTPPYPAGADLATDYIYMPNVPFYEIVGDKSQIASAEVSMRWTPVAPKSPVEHTNSWRAPVGWGIYRVAWRKDASSNYYYFAAMTDAEAAAIVAPKYALKIWSPRDGGYFAYMPVCWDASGVTVPMRDDAAGGLDPYSGYAPFPPDRAASSTLTDYTVANGYSDMAYPFYGTGTSYDSVTVTLRNSGGAVLDTWTGPVTFGATHVPGLGTGPATLAEVLALAEPEPLSRWYWPQEWRGLFDVMPFMPNDISVAYSHDTAHGQAEWSVFRRLPIDLKTERTAPVWEKIGNFRLALLREHPGIIVVHAVNLEPTLIGQKIMRGIVAHGVLFSPTRYVIADVRQDESRAAMRLWGWTSLADGCEALQAATWLHGSGEEDRFVGIVSDPQTNLFTTLGLPSMEEVAQ